MLKKMIQHVNSEAIIIDKPVKASLSKINKKHCKTLEKLP